MGLRENIHNILVGRLRKISPLIIGRGFVGLEVACWPLVPKFAGSSQVEAVEFLRINKNPQHVGRHGCLSVVIVVCCQVEVSATN